MSNSLWPHGLWLTRLLCPGAFPGKNTGVGCCSLLQGIFPTQGSNPDLLHCKWILYCLSHQGSLFAYMYFPSTLPEQTTHRNWTIPSSLMISCCCCCYVASVVSDSVQPHRWQPTRLSRPWDSPGKNTGVCCHFLLQCMKVKSESEVTQSCPTLSDPTDCSPLGSSIHGIFQARVLQWGAIAFSKDILKERKFLRYVWLKLGTNTKEFLFHVFAAIIVVIWLGLLWSPRRLIG